MSSVENFPQGIEDEVYSLLFQYSPLAMKFDIFSCRYFGGGVSECIDHFFI